MEKEEVHLIFSKSPRKAFIKFFSDQNLNSVLLGSLDYKLYASYCSKSIADSRKRKNLGNVMRFKSVSNYII